MVYITPSGLEMPFALRAGGTGHVRARHFNDFGPLCSCLDRATSYCADNADNGLALRGSLAHGVGATGIDRITANP